MYMYTMINKDDGVWRHIVILDWNFDILIIN